MDILITGIDVANQTLIDGLIKAVTDAYPQASFSTTTTEFSLELIEEVGV